MKSRIFLLQSDKITTAFRAVNIFKMQSALCVVNNIKMHSAVCAVDIRTRARLGNLHSEFYAVNITIMKNILQNVFM